MSITTDPDADIFPRGVKEDTPGTNLGDVEGPILAFVTIGDFGKTGLDPELVGDITVFEEPLVDEGLVGDIVPILKAGVVVTGFNLVAVNSDVAVSDEAGRIGAGDVEDRAVEGI